MKKIILILSLVWLFSGVCLNTFGQKRAKLLEVGVAKIDITPERPIRLTGYADRDLPFEKIHHRLWSKALAFGNAKDGYSLLISADLLGIPASITERLRRDLAKEINIKPENISICATHTHSGPMIGTIISPFNKILSPDELAEVALYSQSLLPKFKEVSLAAIQAIAPSQIYWGLGKLDFAVNRRGNIQPNGPSDHDMPFMKITDKDGKVKAVMLSYACHAVTLGPRNNVVHGDWIGEAQIQIEEKLPAGAIAMVTVGCGGDQNSSPRMNKNPALDLEHARIQGKSVAEEVSRIIASKELKQIKYTPTGALTQVELFFEEMPSPYKLAEDVKSNSNTREYALHLLGKLARSELAEKIYYPIQVWNFGKDLSMIFLAGEAVVDYSLRIKHELGRDRIWVNAYANDMPSYIPSLRLLKEGGYEVDRSMIGYEKPSRYTEAVEETVMNGLYQILPTYLKTHKQKSKDRLNGRQRN